MDRLTDLYENDFDEIIGACNDCIHLIGEG